MRKRCIPLAGLSLGVLLALTLPFHSTGKPTAPAPLDHTTAVALHVARYSQRTESHEGRHDLVKDTVRTTTTATGKTIIEQVGEASFYGPGFHGRPTASGTRFNRRGLTAAHPTLPLGTRARVTNLASGKSVSVRITDRGPYAKGRDLDLSQAAAAKVGLTQKNGEVPVKIEAALPPPAAQSKIAAAAHGPPTPRKLSPGSGGRHPQEKR
jgi:rare lipoprotein A (peptidoglycan hydrolase)